MYNDALIRLLQKSATFARQYGSRELDLVHLLVVMLEEDSVVMTLKTKGISEIDLRFLLLKHLEGRPLPAQLPEEGWELDPSPLIQTVLRRCRDRYGEDDIVAFDILEEIIALEDQDGQDFFAVIAIHDLIKLEAEKQSKEDELRNAVLSEMVMKAPSIQQTVGLASDFLNEFAVDLVGRAYDGELDPVYGRDEQIDRLTEILSRRKKNNPILLGEPGVGKTAIVEGLASRIAAGSVPENLKNVRIFSLDIGNFVSGTRNRGDFEERLTRLLEDLEDNPDYVIFIDEIHSIVGGVQAANDAAELMKPALASGRVRCIGATTHGEYMKYFSKNPAMARRFQPIAVPEPTKAQAADILQRLVSIYADHHRVSYADTVVPLAVELTSRFILDRFLPDKAIDVVDEAGAVAAARNVSVVDDVLIHEIVSRMAGVKTTSDPSDIDDLGHALKQRVIGQPDACEKIVKAVSRSNFGIHSSQKARCSMLFVGPDGSGKRFTASQIADIQNIPFFKLDMGNFRESHTVTRLIGSPPGYIGFEAGGQLTEAVRRNPTCLLLIERIDLAHPDVLSVVTNAMDTGAITDAKGNNIPFSGVTVVMTKAEGSKKATFGFRASADNDTFEDEVGLSDEIIDAVDDVVRFKAISETDLELIAKEKMIELSSQLAQIGVKFEATDDIAASVAHLAREKGGTTRDLQRAFRKLAENPIIDASPKKGQVVRLNAHAHKFEVEVG